MLLSPTAINTYLECPRKFYERYMLGRKSQPTIHTILGVVVHAVLKRFFDLNPEEIPEKDSKDFLMSWIEGLLQEEWNKAQKDLETISPPSSAIDKAKGRSRWLLKKWLDRVLYEAESVKLPIREAFKKLTPTHREVRLKSEEYNLQGVIDALYEDEKEVRIVDYKTGRNGDAGKEKRQLVLYGLLCEEELGRKAMALECDRLVAHGNRHVCGKAELAAVRTLSKWCLLATASHYKSLYPCRGDQCGERHLMER